MAVTMATLKNTLPSGKNHAQRRPIPKQIHPAFGRDWVDAFDLAKAMKRRTGTGMPGPAQVQRQLVRWRKALG